MTGWRPLLLLAALLSWAPAAAAAPARPVEVEVVRDQGRWTADFRFPADRPAWVFRRSPLAEEDRRPWRPGSWTVETPGVVLERRGRVELLRRSDGGPVPRRLRIRFQPFGGRVISDYDPAITLTDGSVALFSDQFDLLPVASLAAIDGLPTDLDDPSLPPSPLRLVMRDAAGPVVLHGRSVQRAMIDDGAETYVLFGRPPAAADGPVALILDPELPAWIGEALQRVTPRVLATYQAALGPRPGGVPTLIVGWSGPTNRLSIGGGTLPGLIVMRFEGRPLLAPDRSAIDTNLWFIAHEAAHFWLGDAVRYETARDSWITEGGADLLAIRAMAEADPDFDAAARLQTAVSDCARLTAGRGIATAFERDEQQAYYACGALFGLVAERATGRPFSDFVRTLIEGSGSRRLVTRAAWIAQLDHASGNPALGAAIGRLIDEGAADPPAALASLLTLANIPFAPGEDGVPRLR